MEMLECKALNSFKGTAPSHWFRYVVDTWVKIKTQEVQAFTEHNNSVDKNIKFTKEDVKDNHLPFLDCDVHFSKGRNLHIGVYRKPTHRDQYLLFDSHHPLDHKLDVNPAAQGWQCTLYVGLGHSICVWGIREIQ